MDSSELYNIKQQFTLGAYRSLANLTVPDLASPGYASVVLYKARAHIALNDTKSVSQMIPESTENVALKAVAALARYIGVGETAAKDAALEELRDLCVEIEGEDGEATDRDKDMVRVLAGTAFVRAGELEEALETLGAGTNTENLEAVACIVQIYLSINRVDLAKKEFERAKQWAEDDILLQLIESSIGLVTGKGYSDSHSFYTEQLGNPSLSSPHLLTARGVVRLMRGDIPEAKSDLEESLVLQAGDAETQAAMVVAAGLDGSKQTADELWNRLVNEHPDHAMVIDVLGKAEAFDSCASKFAVPALAVSATA